MTKAQERARARRRWEKRQAAEAAKAKRREIRQRRTIFITTIVVVVVLAGFAVWGILGQRGNTPLAESTPTDSATYAEGCTPVLAGAGTIDKTLTMPSKKLAAGKKFTATLTTNCGPIIATLDGTKAPQATSVLSYLADQSFYNNTPCHRLVDKGIYVLQCGDPTGTGTGSVSFGYGVENAPKDNVYPRGTIAMARTNDVKKGTSNQFFIVYKDSTIPGGYTIVGKVDKGMDIVDRVAALGSANGDGAPNSPVAIESMTVTEQKG